MLVAALLDGLFEHRAGLGGLIPDFKMIDFGKEISSVMSSLSKEDFEGALPYLMLTSKCEHVFRDLLAIRMRRNLQKPNAKQCYEVVREKTFKKKKKKTVDIGILPLRSKTVWDPVAILELKYVATPTTVAKYCEEIKSDLKTAKDNVKPSGEDPGYFGLLLIREARKVQSDNTDDFTEIIRKY